MLLINTSINNNMHNSMIRFGALATLINTISKGNNNIASKRDT